MSSGGDRTIAKYAATASASIQMTNAAGTNKTTAHGGGLRKSHNTPVIPIASGTGPY